MKHLGKQKNKFLEDDRTAMLYDKKRFLIGGNSGSLYIVHQNNRVTLADEIDPEVDGATVIRPVPNKRAWNKRVSAMDALFIADMS